MKDHESQSGGLIHNACAYYVHLSTQWPVDILTSNKVVDNLHATPPMAIKHLPIWSLNYVNLNPREQEARMEELKNRL